MTAPRPQPHPSAQIPRWVKLSGIVAAIAVVLLLLVLLLSGGNHGPGRHAQSAGIPFISEVVR